MKLLVEWGVPTKIAGRLYKKGSILLCQISLSPPGIPHVEDFKSGNWETTSDIMLIDMNQKYRKIGECKVISDDIGLWVTDTSYYIDEVALNKILQHQSSEMLKQRGVERCTTELSMVCNGHDTDGEIKDAEFKFVVHQLYDVYDMNELMRDLKINSVIN